MRPLFELTSDSDVLTVRHGTSPLPFVGVGFLVLGIPTVSAAVVAVFGTNAEAFPLIICAFFGVLFTATGAVLAFYRTGFTINRKDATLVSWSQFLWWRSAHRHYTSDFDALVLVRYPNSSRIGPEWLYRLDLRAMRPTDAPLELVDSLSQQHATDTVAALAQFVHFPVVEQNM